MEEGELPLLDKPSPSVRVEDMSPAREREGDPEKVFRSNPNAECWILLAIEGFNGGGSEVAEVEEGGGICSSFRKPRCNCW